MKTTGVARRIDDLGRIVIPKEIRKNLKIREGELLEIMVDEEKIILSKHSTMKKLEDIAKACIDAINDTSDINMIITDRDKVIATSSQMKKKYMDKELSIDFSEILLKHNPIIEREPKQIKIDNDTEETSSYVAYPIISDGDVAGSVVVLGLESKIKEDDEKLAEFVSKILMHNII